jgi:hypothetical protein
MRIFLFLLAKIKFLLFYTHSIIIIEIYMGPTEYLSSNKNTQVTRDSHHINKNNITLFNRNASKYSFRTHSYQSLY